MKILVTGGTGFLGRPLVAALKEAGHLLVVSSRDPERGQQRDPGTEFTRLADGSSPLPACDAIIHLAGESVSGIWTPRKRRAIRDSRIEGTRRLVASMWAMPEPPRLLISASAVGYYGDRGDEIVTDESPKGGGFLSDVCQGWEDESRRAESFGVRVCNPRVGIVLGRGGGALSPLVLLARIGLNGALGSGRQWFPWIHLEDAVSGLLHILNHDLTGPINLTAPNPVRQADFARILGKAMNRPSFMPTPSILLRAVLDGFAAELLNSRRIVPQRLQREGYEFRYAALRLALASLRL